MHESTPYNTSNYINELQNQLAYIERNIYMIERTEIIDTQVWLHSPEKSVAYLDVEGKSLLITNHLSDVTYKIQGGEGRLATESSQVELQPGTEVTIFKGHTYQYAGEFDAIAEARPGLNTRFVTFGDHKLAKKAAKELKQLQGGHPGYIKAIAKMLNFALEAVDLTNPNTKDGYL